MALTPGAHIGPYEVTALIGEGGMGSVWRAHHTALNRDDALKVLPEAFSSDPDRLARFRREAQVLASLNHPNIAHVYGFEQSDGGQALVMELVDGPTLAERIAQGPIPIDEALPIAKQIAEALEAAHEQGIIHRDLKPSNIKLRPDGTVKVLDFGLAKALERATVRADVSQSPTITSPAMTYAGVILGTAAYMSPEQAKGRPADKRSDMWAFGCVLYEMLTGKQAFPGEDLTEILASVVKGEPDWQALPAATPSSIRTLLFRCLRKDIKKRSRDAGDVVIELDEALAVPATTVAVGTTVGPILSHRLLTLGFTAFVVGGLITGLAVWRLKPLPITPVSRFTIALPPGQRLAGLNFPAIAISPDGRRFVYVASSGGPQQLYVKEMDSLEGKPIPGTEGAVNPFFSPDGQSVGFFTFDRLKKVAISGGPPEVLARVGAFGRGGTWGSDGNIVFAPSPASGLSLVSAAGGTVQALTKLDGQQAQGSHRFPHHLPGGRAVVFTGGTGGGWDDAQIEVLNLGTGERKVLITGGSDGRYVPTGHLVYLRTGTLLAVPVDLGRLQATGSPVPVVEGLLGPTSNNGGGQAAFAATGTLFYIPGGGRGYERTLTWVDRAGTEQRLELPPRAYDDPRLSPDGERVVLSIDEGNKTDVWVYNLPRGTLMRLTVDGLSAAPIWTSDGKKITYSSGTGPPNFFWKPEDVSGPEERLTTSENAQFSAKWSPDGETLAYTQVDLTTFGSDIWMLSLKNGRKAEPLLRTPFNEKSLAFSANGRWIAYQSDESGRDEVYVQPFPGPGRKDLVSTDGGTDPVWSRDGHELFYRNGDKMMAVATIAQPTLQTSKPEILFEKPFYAGSYDVTSNGRRFLMLKENEDVAAATHINVVESWFEELKRLVPTK